MIFTTLPGTLFWLLVVLVFWQLQRAQINLIRDRFRQSETWVLVLASLAFYAWGEPYFVWLLVACVAISYLGGLIIETRPSWGRATVILCVALLLMILGVMKYADFILDAARYILASAGISIPMTRFSLALPIAISFYTFQSIGYLCDVFWGRIRAERSLANYTLFLIFFPQLVAGPIERATNLLAQIRRPRRAEPADLVYGSYLILQGVAKKVVIADRLAPMVDATFAIPQLSAPIIIVTTIAFAFQIYCDFSGYTDIARGIARCLGYRILLNFNRPYRSLNMSEFWHRWHITLSQWFRDYVFIPLGGSYGTRLSTDWNLFVTMSLSGLWHGASLNFVCWGIFHGVLLIVHKWYTRTSYQRSQAVQAHIVYRFAAWSLTFVAVLYGWLIFRIEDISLLKTLSLALVRDWRYSTVSWLLASQVGFYVTLSLAIEYLETRYTRVDAAQMKPCPTLPLSYSSLALIIFFFGSLDGRTFIYFRF